MKQSWNETLKHVKIKYTNFLYDVCSMSNDDEHSIHHEFSSSAMALDKLQVQKNFASISRREIPLI